MRCLVKSSRSPCCKELACDRCANSWDRQRPRERAILAPPAYCKQRLFSVLRRFQFPCKPNMWRTTHSRRRYSPPDFKEVPDKNAVIAEVRTSLNISDFRQMTSK